MHKIEDREGNYYEIDFSDEKEEMSFFVIDGKNEIGHIVLDKKKEENRYLPIKDAYVDVKYRGKSLWKNLMAFVKDFVKKEGYKGLVSYGQFRRPASDKSWKGIKDKIAKQNPRTKKIDYFYEYVRTFEEFEIIYKS